MGYAFAKYSVAWLFQRNLGCFLEEAGLRKLIQSFEGEGSCLFPQVSCLLPQVLIVLERGKYPA